MYEPYIPNLSKTFIIYHFFQHLVGRHIFFQFIFIVDYFLLIFVLPLLDEAYSIGLDNLFHVFLESVGKYFIEYL